MRLTKIQFTEYEKGPKEWRIEETVFGDINLIVGKNSSGKTRLLNVINGLAKLLSGKNNRLYDNGCYKVEFECLPKHYVYELDIVNYQVNLEKFIIDGKIVLDRGESGVGVIDAVELNGPMRFQSPVDQLAAVNRRDAVQHPFFEELYQWAISVKHYLFGSEFGKNILASPRQDDADSTRTDSKITDPNYVIGIFRAGLQKYGEDFKANILKDFGSLGYDCSDVLTLNISEFLQDHQQFISLAVQERSLNLPTIQLHMSQGMFRALALAIQLNYTILENVPACILVDDIGEGLDFSRSSNMILLLIEKATQYKFQLFMTTNDRFVMNSVPLEYWSILHREGGVVRIFNKNNSPKVFDEFEYVGLNNFDFFSSEYFLGKDE